VPHPDESEARDWVKLEIEQLRALSYEELLRVRDEPIHHAVQSRTGRTLMGETQVWWDSGEAGPLRVTVDICEPKPGLVRSIATDDFIRAPDGTFIDET
jgi:hypothetical protein